VEFVAANTDAQALEHKLAPIKLQLGTETLTVDDVSRRVHTPDLLYADQAMLDFVALYTAEVGSDRQRLTQLHRAITGRGVLGVEYDPLAGGGAQDVFYRGSANCLSFAHLFVALARAADLDASYQWLELRPEWTRMGERVMVRMHVNVLVELGGGEHYMVDVDPRPTRDITATRRLSDRQASALYHSNIAMEALAEEQFGEAWLQAVRALQLDPATPHLWTNLGAVYRVAGQHREAEASYLYALELDPRDGSAMNNLMVLYGLEGREEERSYWEQRVAVYREANPYFHAWQGDMAAEQGDWQRALNYYREALARMPLDSGLLHSAGMAHYQLDQLAEAAQYLEQALANAVRRSEIEQYGFELAQVKRDMLAAVRSAGADAQDI
jgi:Flp pilus assembly protein TadD